MGQDESDGVWLHQILSDTRSEVSCDTKLLQGGFGTREQVYDEKHLELLASQEEALPLPVEEEDFHL